MAELFDVGLPLLLVIVAFVTIVWWFRHQLVHRTGSINN